MAIILFLEISGIMVGCGKKGPPLPPLALMPPVPAHVSYRLTADQVMLQWTLDPEISKRNGTTDMEIEIYRATRSVAETACRDCPLSFEKTAELPVSALDYGEALERGYQYFYRLRIRQNDDILGDYSETVSFDFE